MRPIRRTIALLTVLLVGAAACAGDPSPDERIAATAETLERALTPEAAQREAEALVSSCAQGGDWLYYLSAELVAPSGPERYDSIGEVMAEVSTGSVIGTRVLRAACTSEEAERVLSLGDI